MSVFQNKSPFELLKILLFKRLPAEICVLILLTPSVLAYIPKDTHLFDLISHFRMQYAVACVIYLLFLIFRKKVAWIPLALFVIALNSIELAPAFQKSSTSDGRLVGRFKVLHMNVRTETTGYSQAIDAINRADADIVSLNESDQNWLDHLKLALQRYPYHFEKADEDHFSIALYSKIPLRRARLYTFTPDGPPSILAETSIQNRDVTILATHPYPPVSEFGYQGRNAQLAAIAKMRQQLGPDLIVVGDLNTTPYAYAFKRFLKASELKDSSQGFGYQPTWPAYLPPLLIPIDHVLVSKNFVVLNRRTGPYIGSDHLPVIVELGLKE